MDQYYYCIDGKTVEGPHNTREILELIREGVLAKESHVARADSREWVLVGEFIETQKQNVAAEPVGKKIHSEIPTETPDQTVTMGASEEEKESQKEDEEDFKKQRRTRHQLLRGIRGDLDRLWECQREAIIAAIRNEELGAEYETTRRQNKQIYQNIEEKVVNYWRQSGVLKDWIEEMTWKEADYTRKLRGSTEAEKYADFQSWLVEKDLAELAGCYCFKVGREYLYIGKADELRKRIKDHEQKTFFTYATSIRIVIPKYKTQVEKLERLLILAHQPKENRNEGKFNNNPADNCLEFIASEIKELVTDF
jgi:predicted GIY-YIG superfamily endonuclease